MKHLLVYVSVWLAVGCWFVGAFARLSSSQPVDGDPKLTSDAERSRRCEQAYRISWLVGAVLLIVHIVASYGYVHHWNHAEALRATADESEQVTGVRAPWGVYVNLVFATAWLSYCVLMIARDRRTAVFDVAFFSLSVFIVLAATVIFEAGIVRGAATVGFIGLAIQTARLWRAART